MLVFLFRLICLVDLCNFSHSKCASSRSVYNIRHLHMSIFDYVLPVRKKAYDSVILSFVDMVLFV